MMEVECQNVIRLLTLLLIVDPTIRQTVIKGMLNYNIVSMFRVCFPAC